MRIKAIIEGIEEWFYVDTGFTGDAIVTSEVFEPFSASNGGEICLTTRLCFSVAQKYAMLRILNYETLCRCLWYPGVEENIIGEGILSKVGLILDYKKFEVKDP